MDKISLKLDIQTFGLYVYSLCIVVQFQSKKQQK